MSAGTSEFFCLICLLLCSCTSQNIIEAELGKNVILPCKVPNKYNNVHIVEWNRPDQEPDYVLFYRDGHIDPRDQHPSYQNRVDLQDKEMKDGDASMILKNVTKNDAGIYECRVFQKGNIDLISNTILEVHPPVSLPENDSVDGSNVGIIVGSVVGVILLLLALVSVGFVIYGRHRRQNPHLPVPPVNHQL